MQDLDIYVVHTDGAVEISLQLSPTGSTHTASSDSDEDADSLDVSAKRSEHIAEVITSHLHIFYFLLARLVQLLLNQN